MQMIMIIFLTDNHDLHFSDFFKVGEYESSEPTSLATTSTMEGEHTLSPGAGEEGGEGLGEVGFPGERNLDYQFCHVSPALWVLLFQHLDLKALYI